MYYKAISFGTTLTNPHVCVIYRKGSTTDSYGWLSEPPLISNLSTTGFTIYTSMKLSNYWFDWIAIGY